MTGSVASGASTSRNDAISTNAIDIVKVKVAPSNIGAAEFTVVEIFNSSSFATSALCYATNNFAGNLIDPIWNDGITVAEKNQGFIAKYQDLDLTQQLHLKITNNGTLSKTYTVTIEYMTQTDEIRYAANFAGADAGAQIAAAIADLPSTGGTIDARGLMGAQAISSTITTTVPTRILLGAGTYTSSAATAIFQLNGAGSSIEGVGRTATILVTTQASTKGINLGAANQSVRNLTIRGTNSASSGADGINGGTTAFAIIEDCIIEQWGEHALNTGGTSTFWKIKDNLIQNNTNNGVFLGSGTTDCLVIGNTILSNGSNGVDMNGGRNLIKDNIIRLNGGAGGSVDQWGILVQALNGVNADYNSITGNVVSATGSQGIIIRATAGQTANYINITDNIITGCLAGNGDGIALDGTAAGTLQGIIISGNIVQGNAGNGILLNGASTAVLRNCVVTSNICQGNVGTGVYVTGANCFDALVGENTSMSNGTQFDFSGAIRPFGSNLKNNTTAFGYTMGSDIVGGTNNWALRDLTAGANRILIDSSGNVTIQSGLFNANGTFTVGNGGSWSKILIGSAALNFPNTAAQNSSDLTITVTGAAAQDICLVGPDASAVLANSCYTAFVSAPNTVTVRFNNYSAGALDPANASFKVTVIHF